MSTTAPFEATPPLSDQTNLINQLKEERTKLEQLQAQFEIQQLRAQLKLQEDQMKLQEAQMKLREDQLALQAQRSNNWNSNDKSSNEQRLSSPFKPERINSTTREDQLSSSTQTPNQRGSTQAENKELRLQTREDQLKLQTREDQLKLQEESSLIREDRFQIEQEQAKLDLKRQQCLVEEQRAKLSAATLTNSIPELPQSTNPIIECLQTRESTLLEQQVLYTSLRDLQAEGYQLESQLILENADPTRSRQSARTASEPAQGDPSRYLQGQCRCKSN
jgi:hypothetical protein